MKRKHLKELHLLSPRLLSLLVILTLPASCAYRTKGASGIQRTATADKSIALSPEAEIHYPRYVTKEHETQLDFFPVDASADHVITKITYDQVPPKFICATGYPIPLLISFISFGIIPFHETITLEGKLNVRDSRTGVERAVKFEAKRTASWSLWNRIKVGKDREWTRKDYQGNYFKDFLRAKILGN